MWLDSDAEPTANRSPVKIGLITPQAGGLKSIGDDITNGFQLFLDLHDQRLGGHPVELLTADEGDTAKTGKAAVEGLLKQGVLALTGVVNSAVMVGIRDTVEQARVPLIGSNASPSSLQSVFYIWRTSYVLDEAGRALGRYLRDQLPANGRVAIIMPENVGSPDVVRGFRQEFGATDPRIGDPVTYTNATAQPRQDDVRLGHHQGAEPRSPRRSSASSPGRPRWSSSSSCARSSPGRSTHPASSPRAPCWRA